MFRKLYAHLKGYTGMIVLCVFITIFEVVSELLIPLFMSKIVDVGIPNQDIPYMMGMGACMLGVAGMAIFMGVLNAKYSAKASQGFAAALRGDLYRKVQNFSFSNIDQFSGASLLTRLTNDVTNLQTTLMMVLRMMTRAPIMLFTALIIAISINARLSMVLLVSVGVLILVAVLIVRIVRDLFSAVQKRLDAVSASVQENLIAIRVVKAFVREGHEKLKFKKVNEALMMTGIKAGSIAALIMPMMMLVLNATTLSVIWFGGQFVGTGQMSTGELISYISYIMQILMSVMIFSMVFIMLTRARASADRVVEVLATQPDILDPALSISERHTVHSGKIEFRDVSFRYAQEGTEGENVLEHINFTVEPGTFVGIIGSTGSGKTSLINLIPRFYDAFRGSVRIDGVDVREYSQQTLREAIGMVMQKNNLFSGTIKENLLWGNADASMEDVIAAARDAQAHQFIESFPDGYDTVLGQGGVNVSGGQKQRLCIARAMMKKPAILILDDSTSAVDTTTEALIRESFKKNFRESTVIVVAQRISSVREADQIIVLDNGEISAMGTHGELIETSDIYREICISQNEGSVA